MKSRRNKEYIENINYIGIIISIISSSLFIYSFILIRDFFQMGNYVKKNLNLNLLQNTGNYIWSIFVYILLCLLAFIIFACIYKDPRNKKTQDIKIMEVVYLVFLAINLDIIIYQEIKLWQIGLIIIFLFLSQFSVYNNISSTYAIKIIETINKGFIWNIFIIVLVYIVIVNFIPFVGYIFGGNFQRTNYIINSEQTLILEYLDNQKAIVADYTCKDETCDNIIVHSSKTQCIIDLTNVTISKMKFKSINYR